MLPPLSNNLAICNHSTQLVCCCSMHACLWPACDSPAYTQDCVLVCFSLQADGSARVLVLPITDAAHHAAARAMRPLAEAAWNTANHSHWQVSLAHALPGCHAYCWCNLCPHMPLTVHTAFIALHQFKSRRSRVSAQGTMTTLTSV